MDTQADMDAEHELCGPAAEEERGRFVLLPTSADVLSRGRLSPPLLLHRSDEVVRHVRELGHEGGPLHLRRMTRRRWRLVYAGNEPIYLDADCSAGRVYVLYGDRLESADRESLRLYAQLE